LDAWLACQAAWQYLEPIFSSPDIMAQMPEEGDKFGTVDAAWRDVMDITAADPTALAAGRDRERLESLRDANALLDEIQKGLAAYLEVKRIAFPRFFFLSNDEMLEILSETKDPTRVQPHLRKCFEGIAALAFDEKTDVHAMISAEGERVSFVAPVQPKKAQGAVEKWLVQARPLRVIASMPSSALSYLAADQLLSFTSPVTLQKY
jgi:dynein heavy chain, axonemal